MYVIRPFREQEPTALARALWVQLHDKVILFGLFLLITLCALFVWRRAGWVARLLLLAPAMGMALIAAGAPWFNPFEQLMFHPFGEARYVTIQQALSTPRTWSSPSPRAGRAAPIPFARWAITTW